MTSTVVSEALVESRVRGDGVSEDKLVGAGLDYATFDVDSEAIFVPCNPRRWVSQNHTVQAGSFGE